jgi:hypothetical protein
VKIIVATVVAFVGVLVSGAFLMRDPPPPSADGAADPTAQASTAPASSAPPSASPASTSPTAAPRIETAARVFFGRPHETIAIPGTYHGVSAAATLRVQLRVPGGWEDFPLPVVTQETGSFQAYVELGRGEYRLRIVDPATGTTSEDLTLLLL